MALSKKMPLIISRFVIVSGFVLINFWLFIVPVLFDHFEKGMSVAPSCLACSLLVGIAIVIFHQPGFRKVSNILVCIVILVAAFDLSVSIVFHAPFSVPAQIREAAAVWHDQVMSELAAFCFLAFTTGILLAPHGTKQQILAQFIFHAISLIAFLAFTGYVFGVSIFYQPLWAKMSFNASVAIFILSMMASFLNFHVGIPGLLLGEFIGSHLARRLIPMLSVSLLLLGVLEVESRESNWIHPNFGTALFTITLLCVGLVLIWRASLWLNEIDVKRQVAEAETKSVNENLERLVTERTIELQASYERLEAQEKKLRANEKLLSSILKNTSNLVFFKDDLGRYQMINRSFEEHFNVTLDVIKNKTDFDLLPESDATYARNLDNQVLAEQGLVTYQCTYQLPWGTQTFLINKFPVFDEKERLSGVAGIATDITELLMTRKQLHEASDLLAKIFDPNPVGLAIFDPETKKYLQVNASYCQIFGKEKYELEGREATHGIVSTAARVAIEATLAERGSIQNVEVDITVHGISKPHIVSVSPFVAGGRDLLLITVNDITELKKTHQHVIDISKKLEQEKIHAETLNSKLHTTILELESTNRKMADINNNKDRFLAVVSHDLKNPLVGILNLANAISHQTNVTSDLKESLDLIKLSGNEMMSLINNLLDLNRIESGTQVLNLENIHISQIFRRISGSYLDRALKKNIHLRIVNSVDNDTLLTDGLGLYRAIDNLVSNAIKFSPKGRQVFVVAEEIDIGVRFSVIDEGPGIPQAEMKNMFFSYSKLSPRPTDGEPSTGLGLSIVKDWVTLIGGEIVVNSQLGVGSIFQIVLPQSRMSKMLLA